MWIPRRFQILLVIAMAMGTAFAQDQSNSTDSTDGTTDLDLAALVSDISVGDGVLLGFGGLCIIGIIIYMFYQRQQSKNRIQEIHCAQSTYAMDQVHQQSVQPSPNQSVQLAIVAPSTVLD
jgi:hypothetical protein